MRTLSSHTSQLRRANSASQTGPNSIIMTVNGHSTSNRHLVLTGKETLVVEDRPIPKCKPGHVLVKVMATGV